MRGLENAIGVWGEEAVSNVLSKRGWMTYRSPGSRGPCDITATRAAQKWCIQVKVRGALGLYSPVSRADAVRLLRHSAACDSTPVIAVISDGYNMLRVASHVTDESNESIVRDLLGNFVAIRIDSTHYMLMRELRTGKSIEP